MNRDDKISNIVTTSLVLLFCPVLIPFAIVLAAYVAIGKTKEVN
jgi:hypothetical protein